MARFFPSFLTGVALTLLSGSVFAQSWDMDPAASRLAFGSIKKNQVGEVHTFERISGTVSENGAVSIEIDLTSVQTFIDIRNERMREFVFGGKDKATIRAQIDMAGLQSLPIGGSGVFDTAVTLSLLGKDIPMDAELFVLRLAKDKVLVSTDSLVFLNLVDAGVDDGITELMGLASLSGITRTSPITARFVFKAGGEAAPAAAPQQTALAGNAKSGKRVFKKCKACHKLDAGKNGVGPSLHGIIGRGSASVEGFKYSKAMKNADVIWDVETLSAFLKKPKSYMPGTKMVFSGLKKDKDIENLLAYLSENGG